MTNLLRTGVEWLNAQTKACLSDQITYTQGMVDTTLSACLALKKSPDIGGDDVTENANDMEFVVDAADFTITIANGGTDRITLGSRTFKVKPPADNTQPRRMDAYGQQIAIQVEEIL